MAATLQYVLRILHQDLADWQHYTVNTPGLFLRMLESTLPLRKESPFFDLVDLLGGSWSAVPNKAFSAADCCAFFIDGPTPSYSSPAFKTSFTVNCFLWAGPDSSNKMYSCLSLWNLASSAILHIGVWKRKTVWRRLHTGWKYKMPALSVFRFFWA